MLEVAAHPPDQPQVRVGHVVHVVDRRTEARRDRDLSPPLAKPVWLALGDIYILHAYGTCRQHCRVVFDGIVRWYSVVGVVDRLLDGRDDYRSIRLCSRHGKKPPRTARHVLWRARICALHTLNLLARGIRLVSLSFRQWMPSRISTPPGASCFRMPCPLHMIPTAPLRWYRSQVLRTAAAGG